MVVPLAPMQLSGASGGDFPAVTRVGRNVGVAWNEGGSTDAFGAAFTRNGGSTWLNAGQSVNIADTTGDVDFAALSYNARHSNFIACWESNDSGDDHVYAGGFRAPTINTAGVGPTGVAGFLGSGFSGRTSLGIVMCRTNDFFTVCTGDALCILRAARSSLANTGFGGEIQYIPMPIDGNGDGDSINHSFAAPSGTFFCYQAFTATVEGGCLIVDEATDATCVTVP